MTKKNKNNSQNDKPTDSHRRRISGSFVLDVPEAQRYEESIQSETQSYCQSLKRDFFRRIRKTNFILEIIGVLVVLAYTTVAALQWCATRTANQQAKDFFEITQRPYLSLGRKDGILAEFRPESPKPGELTGIKIYLQNGGQSAALTPNIGIFNGIFISTNPATGRWMPPVGLKILRPFQQLLRTRDMNGAISEGGGRGSIPPQSEYNTFIPDLLSQDQMNLIHSGNATLLLYGRLEYCDEFGRYSCRDFSLNFESPAVNDFSEVTDSDCAAAYTYPPRRPDQSYLPPCEQPSEQKQNEKEAIANISQNARTAATVTPSPSPTP